MRRQIREPRSNWRIVDASTPRERGSQTKHVKAFAVTVEHATHRRRINEKMYLYEARARRAMKSLDEGSRACGDDDVTRQNLCPTRLDLSPFQASPLPELAVAVPGTLSSNKEEDLTRSLRSRVSCKHV